MSIPTLVCNAHVDRAGWLAQRRTGIGSSDAPSVLGIEGAYGSPLSVAAAKLGLEAQPGEDTESELMRWGNYAEAPMIQAFVDEAKGWAAARSGDMYRSSDPDTAFMLATLDGVVVKPDGEHGGIECKLKIFGSDEWEGHGVPEAVVCQVQHTMAVMDWEFVIVLALLDGYRLRWREVPRNRELIGDVIVPAERAFWDALQSGRAIDASKGNPDATARALARLYPEDDGTTVALGEEYVSHHEQWLLAKEEEARWKRLKEQHRHALAEAIGSATFGSLPDGKVLSLKTTKRAGYSVSPATFRTLREVAGK